MDRPRRGESDKSLDITLLSDDRSGRRFRVTIYGFYLDTVYIEGKPFSSISLPTASYPLEKGNPEIPKLEVSVIIPDEGGVECQILDEDTVMFDILPVAPSKGSLLRNVNPETIPYTFNEIYESGEWYPVNPYELREPFGIRDYRGITIRLNIFRHNPALKRLKVARNFEVIVTYEKPQLVYRDSISESFWEIYDDLFLNFSPNRYGVLMHGIRMTIITHYAFYNEAMRLREWKMKKGIIVREVHSVSYPTADYIKNYIYDRYLAGVDYFLLIGDLTHIPSLREEGWLSDPRYVMIYPNSEDPYPDAFISRISGMTIQEIRNQIDKILYYERLSPLSSSLDWTEKALVMASHQSGGSSHPIPDSVHKNNMRERLFRKYRLVDKLYDYAAIPSNVKQILENGRGFLNFLSHGDPTKWFFRDPPVNPVFSIEDVNTQQNPYLLPIIFSVACDVGQFSYNPCFAEAWLQQPEMRGAVGFWGSSAPQPWVEPIWADSVAIFFLTCDPRSIYFSRTLGKVTYWGVFSMLQHNFPQGAYTAKTWHLFGDASMEVRVGRQTRLLAEHSRFAIPGKTFSVFVVNTTDGLPCQYAVVCLWKENDNYISCKYTDRYGKVNFILPAELSPGRIFVTVSKLNTIPYEGIAEIIPTNVTCEKATYPNQGELFAIDPGNGNFHIVYNTGEDIVYRKSTDKGASWGDVIEIDSGSYPSLALDYSGMPRITYLKNDTVFCKTLNSDNTWHKTVVFGGDGNIKPGPPVITQTYLPEFADYSYCIFPIKNLSEGTGKIYLSIFNVNEDIGPEPEEVVGGIGLKSPSIAITPGDIIHIVWGKEGEIYYRFGEKDSSNELIWSDIYNISESPEVISENPTVEAYGEYVIVAWKEGELGEIYKRIRNLAQSSLPTWPPGWSGIENISQSPDKESDYPVISTPDVIAWQEEIDSLNYEVIAWIKGSLVNISETENSSKYPHISVEPPAVSASDGAIIIDPKVVINTIWTEEIIPETLYEVRFRRYEYTPTSSVATEYISVAVGDSVVSPYCKQRDGAINYGEFTCDYSSSSLIYNLPYLNPKASYLLRAVVYKETPRIWREEVHLDSQFITEIFYHPYIPETLNIIIPKETYENDLAIRKEIERIVGTYALIADLKVYEVSIPESLPGGGQGLKTGKILGPALYQNRPNPFKGLTKIPFSIPKETYVSLLIYNASGREVRILLSERMRPGNYNLNWDGRDARERELPPGVYFYRLSTGDFREIKKTILLR